MKSDQKNPSYSSSPSLSHKKRSLQSGQCNSDQTLSELMVEVSNGKLKQTPPNTSRPRTPPFSFTSTISSRKSSTSKNDSHEDYSVSSSLSPIFGVDPIDEQNPNLSLKSRLRKSIPSKLGLLTSSNDFDLIQDQKVVLNIERDHHPHTPGRRRKKGLSFQLVETERSQNITTEKGSRFKRSGSLSILDLPSDGFTELSSQFMHEEVTDSVEELTSAMKFNLDGEKICLNDFQENFPFQKLQLTKLQSKLIQGTVKAKAVLELLRVICFHICTFFFFF
jgi:hypothetical protein